MTTQRQRSRAETAQMMERLSNEEWIPVFHFREMLGAPKFTIIRWIRHGFRGVFLDGVNVPAQGWQTSTEAVKRFLAEKARIPKADHDGDEPDKAA